MTESKDPLEDVEARGRRVEKKRRDDVAAMAREIARELHRLQSLENGPIDDQTQPSYRPMTSELISGGREQCEHGVPHGAYLRPTSGTPACPMCRLRFLDERQAASEK